MRRRLAPMICLVLCLAVRAAFGQAALNEVVSFGDSLTHNDLLALVNNNPRDLYGADPMEAVFDKGAGPRDDLTSYAVGGSEADHLLWQVVVYLILERLGFQDAATLFSVEIGGNDILNNTNLLAAHAPGEDPAADAVIDNVVTKMGTGVAVLWATHPNAQFVVWTIPDATLTPDLWYSLSPGGVANVRGHIERANQLIRSLDGFPFVVVLDLYELIGTAVADPPVLRGHQLVPPPAFGDYDALFADDVHPTAVSNAMMANAIIEEINQKWNDDIPVYSEEELAGLAHIPR